MSDLNQLILDLRAAKIEENEAKERRISIEDQIVSLVEDAPDIGSKTLKGRDGRVSIKFGMAFKADVDAIRTLEIDDLPLKFVPSTYAFDQKAYEQLRKDRPDIWRKVSAHVQVTKSKPGVTLQG